jgi:hypothetical protein
VRRAAAALADLAVAVGVCFVLWVPKASDLAGRIFAADRFFHWDHFVMAPALAWRHGMALGTDVYSQYGAGWPVVFSLLAGPSLSHQEAIELGILYACIVHFGLYLLLRVVAGGRLLALAGTALALHLSPLSPIWSALGVPAVWQWPSLSVLRAPMDVWFFLVLLLHARGRRPGLAVLAGALAGLGLFLETDTGLFLTAILAVYGLCLLLEAWLEGPGPAASGPALATLVATLATLAGVVVAGFALSSHGTVFTRPGAFLSGWIGGVTNSSDLGVGARYFNNWLREHAELLPAVLAVIGAGLLAVVHTMARLLHGRLAATSLFAGCVGLCVVTRCTLFVWRTGTVRLTLVAIPLAVLATVALAELRRPLADALRRLLGSDSRRLDHALPLAAALALLFVTFSSSGYLDYPNAWHRARYGIPEAGLVLLPERGEVSGLPPGDRELVRALGDLIADVRQRSARGQRVEIVDPLRTLVYAESGARPGRGDPCWFYNTWTRREAVELAASLARQGPEVIVLRSEPISDVWYVYRAAVERRYELAARFGIFDVWERR